MFGCAFSWVLAGGVLSVNRSLRLLYCALLCSALSCRSQPSSSLRKVRRGQSFPISSFPRGEFSFQHKEEEEERKKEKKRKEKKRKEKKRKEKKRKKSLKPGLPKQGHLDYLYRVSTDVYIYAYFTYTCITFFFFFVYREKGL